MYEETMTPDTICNIVRVAEIGALRKSDENNFLLHERKMSRTNKNKKKKQKWYNKRVVDEGTKK